MRKRKKSLVGWTQKNSINGFKFIKSEPYWYLFIPTVFRGNAHFKHLYMGKSIKIRITIEEL